MERNAFFYSQLVSLVMIGFFVCRQYINILTELARNALDYLKKQLSLEISQDGLMLFTAEDTTGRSKYFEIYEKF